MTTVDFLAQYPVSIGHLGYTIDFYLVEDETGAHWTIAPGDVNAEDPSRLYDLGGYYLVCLMRHLDTDSDGEVQAAAANVSAEPPTWPEIVEFASEAADNHLANEDPEWTWFFALHTCLSMLLDAEPKGTLVQPWQRLVNEHRTNPLTIAEALAASATA